AQTVPELELGPLGCGLRRGGGRPAIRFSFGYRGCCGAAHAAGGQSPPLLTAHPTLDLLEEAGVARQEHGPRRHQEDVAHLRRDEVRAQDEGVAAPPVRLVPLM